MCFVLFKQMSQDYNRFMPEDFLADESFQDFCGGTDAQAIAFWTRVREELQENTRYFDEAVNLFAELQAHQGNRARQFARLMAKVEESEVRTLSPVRKLWPAWVAAAGILLLLGTGWFLSNEEEAVQRSTVAVAADVNPGETKATLTLADGRIVALDSAGTGSVLDDNGVRVLQFPGELAYESNGSVHAVEYHTITTPRGGEYMVVLADGSKVWLNAASSLRYPTQFSKTSREVSLSGEGYFEIAHNSQKPFVVNAGDVRVQVLGTHFNVNAYTDEPFTKTTLLEGSVKVSAEAESMSLQPGEQAVLNLSTQKMVKEKNVQTDEVVAWQMGKFIFRDADLESVMRKLEKWYDVEVVFEGPGYQDQYVGIISRKVPLSQILEMLEKTGESRFEIHGRRIIVK